jgi:hypothetical protein
MGASKCCPLVWCNALLRWGARWMCRSANRTDPTQPESVSRRSSVQFLAELNYLICMDCMWVIALLLSPTTMRPAGVFRGYAWTTVYPLDACLQYSPWSYGCCSRIIGQIHKFTWCMTLHAASETELLQAYCFIVYKSQIEAWNR